MKLNRILILISIFSFTLLFTGCIFPSGPYHYSHDSGFVFDFEEILFTYDDQVVFDIEFPKTTYAIDDHNEYDYYNFLVENDYKMMNDVFQKVLENYEFISMDQRESNQNTYRRTTGSTKQFYNYIDLDIDNNLVITHEGFLINDKGFLLEFKYDSFHSDGEFVVVPLILSKAYYEAFIPISFQSISHGRTTINGVKIINRIEVEYEQDYVYVFPGTGHKISVIYNMENFFNMHFTNPAIINEYIPEPGNYTICRNDETNENCFYTEKSENLFFCNISTAEHKKLDKIKSIYIDFYEGVEIDDSVIFTFLGNKYEFTLNNQTGYVIYPLFNNE